MLRIALAFLMFVPALSRAEEPRAMPAVGLVDASGKRHRPELWKDQAAVVLFFLGTECPVSNFYVPVLVDLQHRYRDRSVLILGVHAEAELSAKAAQEHAREYKVTFPTLLDPKQQWAGPLEVRVVPEVVVLDKAGRVRYQGRIDDRYATNGRRRDEPTTHDLRDALDAILRGDLVAVPRTKGFGCPLPRITPSK